jgi:hypothetical protein
MVGLVWKILHMYLVHLDVDVLMVGLVYIVMYLLVIVVMIIMEIHVHNWGEHVLTILDILLVMMMEII